MCPQIGFPSGCKVNLTTKQLYHSRLIQSVQHGSCSRPWILVIVYSGICISGLHTAHLLYSWAGNIKVNCQFINRLLKFLTFHLAFLICGATRRAHKFFSLSIIDPIRGFLRLIWRKKSPFYTLKTRPKYVKWPKYHFWVAKTCSKSSLNLVNSLFIDSNFIRIIFSCLMSMSF